MNKYVYDKKVRFEKSENGENRVAVSSVYDFNCSGENTVDVSDEVLFWLEAFVREDNNYNRKLRDNPDTVEFDEVKHGEMFGCCEESFEEQAIENIWFENTIKDCGETAIRRARLAVNQNLSARAIAEIEGVHHSSVDESLKKIKNTLCKYTE